jgi:hypothetical protein
MVVRECPDKCRPRLPRPTSRQVPTGPVQFQRGRRVCPEWLRSGSGAHPPQMTWHIRKSPIGFAAADALLQPRPMVDPLRLLGHCHRNRDRTSNCGVADQLPQDEQRWCLDVPDECHCSGLRAGKHRRARSSLSNVVSRIICNVEMIVEIMFEYV